MKVEMARRIPLSCENCRQRKIRCLGSGVPCDTCRRRGVALTCHFKRDPDPGREISQDALLQRISNLEALLQQNIELTSNSIAVQGNRTQLSPLSQSDLSLPNNISNHTPTSISNANYGLQQHGGIPGPQHDAVGSIVTSPTGHVRYIPFNTKRDADLLDRFQNPLHPENTSGFPFSSEMSGSGQAILDMLPPSRQCDELLTVFLDVFSPLFHIIHDPTFHSAYAEFTRNRQAAPKAFTGLVFVTLALAITALSPDNPLLSDLGGEASPAANAKSLAAKYRSAAMKCLAADDFLWQHNLHTLQCLVLLIYAINHARGPAWSLLGTTLNIAVAIGCHVDPALLNVSVVEAEERRRAWAGLMMLYTIQNTCLGSIAPFEITNNVRLPMDVEDDEIMSQSLPMDDLGIVEPSSDDRPPTKMSYILFKFRLYRLASDICSLNSSQAMPQLSDVRHLDDRLHAEKTAQTRRFHRYPDLPMYQRAHSCILDNYTNHLTLLLHRSFLMSKDSIDPGTMSTSYERCEQAAYAIISNYENLHVRPEFRPYSWYTHGIGAFHVFFAMSTLLVMLGQTRKTATSKQVIFHAVQGCLGQIQEAIPFSDICNRAYSMLSPLITRELCQTAMLPGEDSATLGSTGSEEADVHSMPRSTNEECDTFDPNAWPLPEDLEQMVSKISCEQWLSSAVFPWADALHL